jgi:hypothetical protein
LEGFLAGATSDCTDPSCCPTYPDKQPADDDSDCTDRPTTEGGYL